MKNTSILTLNCQKAYHPDLKDFIGKLLQSGKYDFILLQEVTTSVISMITETASPYKILNPFDSILEENTGVCVLYRDIFSLADPLFLSFARINHKLSPRGWGFVGGIFSAGGESCLVGSVHLHPGLNISVRRKELKLVKEMIKGYLPKKFPIIIGGDFNVGFRRELAIGNKTFSPEFVRVTKKLGSTLDSRYTEKAPFMLNKISVFLAKFGIGFTFRTDHLYVDRETAETSTMECRILPDRVSDHNPVELVLTGR
jgi:endonuclease/exonuclease/phosphatase family metal-dependent hydrolase